MRAIVFDQPGGPEVLRIAEVPTPQPGPDDALIRVACAGVNPADWKCRSGMLTQFIAYTYPFVPGFDAAGIVESVGTNVTHLKAGDRVLACSQVGQGKQGSYAEYLSVPAVNAGLMPQSLSFAEAAAIPTAGLTAWQALFQQADLKVGQTLLLHGGSGGVGSYGIQFAKAAGIRVAVTCSTGNVAYVKALGADRVIDYKSEDVLTAVRAWSPGGVDVVIDAVSHGTLPTAFEMLRPGGTLVSIATINGDGDIAGDTAAAAQRGLTKKYALMQPQLGYQQYAEMAPLFDSGQVKSPALEIFPWEQVARAHEQVATGHVRGKIVLTVAELQ